MLQFNINNVKEMKAEDFYKYKYETDKDETYPNYSKLFENIPFPSNLLNAIPKSLIGVSLFHLLL